MLVTSQLPIQTTKFATISFQRALVPPTLKKVPPAMLETNKFDDQDYIVENTEMNNKLLNNPARAAIGGSITVKTLPMCAILKVVF